MDNYTQNKLDADAREHDDAPPMVMTHAKAIALLDAHADGRLMADDLLARARVLLFDEAMARAMDNEWNTPGEVSEYDFETWAMTDNQMDAWEAEEIFLTDREWWARHIADLQSHQDN